MYDLDKQIGYKLRLAQQRHIEIFNRHMPDITPTQFSVMVRLREAQKLSQNELGRSVSMDAATTKGVVDRLIDRGWLQSRPCEKDKRRRNISLTARGKEFIDYAVMAATEVTTKTMQPLNDAEQRQLLMLLDRISTE